MNRRHTLNGNTLKANMKPRQATSTLAAVISEEESDSEDDSDVQKEKEHQLLVDSLREKLKRAEER